MKMEFQFSLIAVLIFSSLAVLSTGFVVEDPVQSLYSENDFVTELVDGNITDIQSSDNIWIVKFYNHWCGHCQRFAATWKLVAESLQQYSPYIKVGAINCATQNSCSSYQITSVPQIIIFNPRNTFSQQRKLISDQGPNFYSGEALKELYQYYTEATISNRNSIDVVTSSSTTIDFITTERPQIANRPDMVHQNDIEKAIQYAISQEIALKPMLGKLELRSFYQFLETLVRFTPNLTDNLKHFLISLREWPQLMGFTSISSSQLKEKVEELKDFYQPFVDTEKEYQYCKGSSSNFRGYPCSLWTLFHALTVNAAKKEDTQLQYKIQSPVAVGILEYVKTFFSCKDCANHFVSAVNKLGYFPVTDNDAVTWLWTLHNMANSRLSGDITEDPQYPKIQWPSDQNCPNCKYEQFGFMGRKEQYWNLNVVKDYIKNVYDEENLENLRDNGNSNLISKRSRQKCLNEIPVNLRQDCTVAWPEPVYTTEEP